MSDEENNLHVSYGFVEKEDDGSEDEIKGTSMPYVKNDDKATDYKYSGFLLMIFGGMGIIFILLTLFGIIPEFFGTPYLSYGVLFAVLVLFFVAGFSSAKSAWSFEKKAKSDNLLEKRIIDFVKDEITQEKIDEAAGIEDGDEPEIMYFKRTDLLKSFIINKFVNIDPDFLDNLIDEKIYDMIFEEDSEEESEKEPAAHSVEKSEEDTEENEE
ncbi:MAG: hypothetical protein K5871_02750 [Lachnospiraceae bacterium]|nr:hypothetical protein [Lachnospiraceae bacterium]